MMLAHQSRPMAVLAEGTYFPVLASDYVLLE